MTNVDASPPAKTDTFCCSGAFTSNAVEVDATREPEEESASPIFYFLYTWASPMFARGYARANRKEPLEADDILKLPLNEQGAPMHAAFSKCWEEERERNVQAVKKWEEDAALLPPEKVPPRPQPRIVRALVRSCGKFTFIGGVLRLFSDAASVASPFLLRAFITKLGEIAAAKEGDSGDVWKAFLWCFALAINQFIGSLCLHGQLHFTGKSLQQMRSAVTIEIYEKSLRLEGSHGATGFISQMHSTDTCKFTEMGFFLHSVWSAPIVIIAAVVGLYIFIGWAGVLSVAIMAIFIPMQGFLAKQITRLRSESAKAADRRLQSINEYLQGIRIVKFMCWEKEAETAIGHVRQEELERFNPLFVFRGFFTSINTSMTVVVSFAVFAIAYSWGTDITAKAIFPTIAMLTVLRMPLATMSVSIGKLIDLSIALDRIQQFLLSPERDAYLQDMDSAESAIVVKDATLQYRAVEDRTIRKTIMSSVNLCIPKGKLTLVIGPTGSGKSTIMTAMVGEGVVEHGGYVAKCGQIAYMTQEAWIMNATLRENILMGRPFDEDKYLTTVCACQLLPDLAQLTGSDQTEIGERGVNLSGGQKQRIAFARAVYSEREIVLMDDPLSAVDAHVCSALFQQVITGLLQSRTRVLVTHQTQFLPFADYIVVVKDRRIAFCGTQEELQHSCIDISSIVETPSGSPTAHAAPHALPSQCASPIQILAADGKKLQIPPPQEGYCMSLVSLESTVGAVSGGAYMWYGKVSGWGNLLLVLLSFCLWRAVMCFSDLMVSCQPVFGQTLTQDQYCYWYALTVALTVICVGLRQIPFIWAIRSVAAAAHGELLHSVLNAPSSFFDTTPTGRIINRFSKDMEAIDLVIPESLMVFYNLTLTILGAVGVMIYSAYYLAIIIVVLVFLFVLLFRYYLATNRAQKRLEINGRSPVLAIMNDTLGGLPTIRAYGLTNAFSQRHVCLLDKSARPTYSWRVSQRWLGSRVDWISCAINLFTGIIVLLMLNGMDKSSQRSNVGTFALAVTYSISIGNAMWFLTTLTADLEAAMSSVEHVQQYVENIPQEKVASYGSAPDDVHAPPASWPEKGQVCFEALDVCYRPGLPLVLRSLTFTVDSGKHVGVVGRTGSGKSTIMLTLFRMVEPAAGHILIDGVDITTLSMFDLRSKLTILPQDPVLFSGTICTNLDPFGRFTEEEVWDSLARVGMLDRVRLDEKGLECPVAERGANFSVGQRQLLCLARAMLKQSRILLMDEATASVDFESDAMIQRTIREQFVHCTVITIAHRLATVIDYDAVLVLDKGELVEYDSPHNLLKRPSSQFFDMVKQLGEEQFADLVRQAADSASIKAHGQA